MSVHVGCGGACQDSTDDNEPKHWKQCKCLIQDPDNQSPDLNRDGENWQLLLIKMTTTIPKTSSNWRLEIYTEGKNPDGRWLNFLQTAQHILPCLCPKVFSICFKTCADEIVLTETAVPPKRYSTHAKTVVGDKEPVRRMCGGTSVVRTTNKHMVTAVQTSKEQWLQIL